MEVIHYRALATHVLAVATARREYDGKGWTCYIDAVPGISHKDEAQRAAENGDKPSESVARAIFPEFKNRPFVD
jgi:hypothetical protein